MANIVLSEYIEAELAAVWDFIAEDNPDAADRFLEAADATFHQLAQMPGMGRARDFNHPRLGKLRSFRIDDFESYLVFYCLIDDGIEVFHVLHGARDLDAFFDEG